MTISLPRFVKPLLTLVGRLETPELVSTGLRAMCSKTDDGRNYIISMTDLLLQTVASQAGDVDFFFVFLIVLVLLSFLFLIIFS